jgi:hypothetical protein
MRYRRDIQALRAAPPRIVIAVGTTSKGQLANRTAVALAGQLGTSVVEFPGDPRRIRGRVLDQSSPKRPDRQIRSHGPADDADYDAEQ